MNYIGISLCFIPHSCNTFSKTVTHLCLEEWVITILQPNIQRMTINLACTRSFFPTVWSLHQYEAASVCRYLLTTSYSWIWCTTSGSVSAFHLIMRLARSPPCLRFKPRFSPSQAKRPTTCAILLLRTPSTELSAYLISLSIDCTKYSDWRGC